MPEISAFSEEKSETSSVRARFFYASSTRTYNIRWLIPLIAISALLGWASFLFFPSSKFSREVAPAQALSDNPLPSPVLVYAAETFCSEWTGLPTVAVDCRSGYALDRLEPVVSPQAETAWAKARAFCEQEIGRYTLLIERLQAIPSEADQMLGLRLALQQKVDGWRELIASLSTVPPQQIGHGEYRRLFPLILDLGGSSYDATNDRFRRINWHVARLIETQPAILVKVQNLQYVLRWIPWTITAISAILMLIGWSRARWTGLLLMAGFSTITWLGLLMTADASVHYGEGSGVFLLNPLGNQLARQYQVLWIGAFTIAATAWFAMGWGAWLTWPLRHLWFSMVLLLLLVGAAYGLQGPAMGAEVLKVSMALLAGLVTSAHGRSVHLASQLTPQSLSIRRILLLRTTKFASRLDAHDLIAHHLGKPVFQLAIFGILGLAIAALAFHDLGAALVTGIVAVCALFLVFGARITTIVVVLMSFIALGLSLTSKVQERIALMLDPMGASVSDFARLVAFSNAAHDHGFTLGQMPWCNPSGVCLPLQALSDYMPVVLSGLFGFNAALIYFSLFLLVLLGMGHVLMRSYLTRHGHARTLAIMAFYLLVCTGAQTVITFLGNWRIIPLTGIGAPLLSIGLSSTLVPCLTIGLFLALHDSPALFVKPNEAHA